MREGKDHFWPFVSKDWEGEGPLTVQECSKHYFLFLSAIYSCNTILVYTHILDSTLGSQFHTNIESMFQYFISSLIPVLTIGIYPYWYVVLTQKGNFKMQQGVSNGIQGIFDTSMDAILNFPCFLADDSLRVG